MDKVENPRIKILKKVMCSENIWNTSACMYFFNLLNSSEPNVVRFVVLETSLLEMCNCAQRVEEHYVMEIVR